MSNQWNAGYVTDVNYTFGYYTELNPFRSRLPLLLTGRHAPRIENACELGFGQGLSVSIHAAAQPGVKWYGTDFNPAQAAFAAEMVRLSGADARLYDQAFSEFCSRTDLPDFDFIGLHGIWSWISDENRTVLVDFIRRKLRPGGALYISYNTNPGWMVAAPLRHLMKRHVDVMGVPGQGIIGQADSALTFIEEFLASAPAYARLNPVALERLKQIKTHDRKYVAHEYLNRDWHPMYFADLEAILSDAKLDFAGSAYPIDNMPELNLTPDQSKFLQGVPNNSLRETLRDFCVNQQFRRDYWLRGARALTGQEQIQAVRDEWVVLSTPRADWPTVVKGAVGEAKLLPEIHGPVLELLSDHKPHSILELETEVGTKNVNFSQLRSALTIMLGMGVIHPAAAPKDVEIARPRTMALNKAIARRSLSVAEINYFASPVMGSGIPAPRFHQLFWWSRQNGGAGPEDWAQFTWSLLQAQGQQLVKGGETLQGDANLVELRAQAELWETKTLPVWTALGI